MKKDFELAGIVQVSGAIVCRTGLHIGGNPEGAGGIRIDSPVVRDPMTGYPYLPGSSLKGKLRILAEWALGRYTQERGSFQPCSCNECQVCRIFGVGAKARMAKSGIQGPTRLVVQDAFPEGFPGSGSKSGNGTTGTTAQRLAHLPSALPFTEWKKENCLDRITSAASPRDVERVPAGSVFEFELAFSLFEPADLEAIGVLFMAMDLLERNYLGGSGSRGYGKVAFRVERIEFLPRGWFVGEKGVEPRRILEGVTRPGEIRGRVGEELKALVFQEAPA